MSEKKIIAQCKDNGKSFISANGRWLPCCMVPSQGDYFKNSIFSRPEFDINNNIVEDFHELDIFKLWIDYIEDNYDQAPAFCQKHCNNKVYDYINNNDNVIWPGQEFFKITRTIDLFDFLEDNNVS